MVASRRRPSRDPGRHPDHRVAVVAVTLISLALSLVAELPAAAASPAAIPMAAGQPWPPRTDIKRSDLRLLPGKLAELSDDGPHPGSAVEWWYVHVMDPKSRRVLVVVMASAPVSVTAAIWLPGTGAKVIAPDSLGKVTATARPGQLAVRSDAASLVWDKARRAFHLVMGGRFTQADIWFDRALPGPTGGPITFSGGQEFYWTAPVGTSYVKGWIKPPGSTQRVKVNDWRGYHDHNWAKLKVPGKPPGGNILPYGWQWAVVHEPDGTATALGGVVDEYGTWRGAVGRATPQGTFGCMTTLKLSDWRVSGLYSYPNTTTASCPSTLRATPQGLTGKGPGLNITFRVVDPFILDAGLLGITQSKVRTVPGSLGMIEHLRSPAGRFG